MEPVEKTPKSKKKIILIVAGLALLSGCLTGAYLWHSQVQELKANRDSSQQKIDQLEKQIKEISKNDISSNTTNQKFLEIKEWGIKIPRDENLKDITYIKESTDGSGDAIMLTTPKLVSLSSSCKLRQDTDGYTEGPLRVRRITIEEANTIDPVTEMKPINSIDGVKAFGYYYHYVTPQAVGPCTEKLENGYQNETYQDAIKSLKESIKGIVKI